MSDTLNALVEAIEKACHAAGTIPAIAANDNLILATVNADEALRASIERDKAIEALIAELRAKAQADAKAHNAVTGIAVAWDSTADRLQSLLEGRK